MPSVKTPIRTGLIGLGKMGHIRHKAAQAVKGIDIVAAHEPFQPVAQFHDIPVKSIDDILADQTIDAVIICTANNLNYPLTVRALNAGKHVFCEKPPAFTAGEVQDIIRVEKQSGRQLMYGFNHRHHGGAKKMHDIVQEGAFGRVLWMRGRYGKSVDSDFFGTWRSDAALAGGGILLDQGIHMLDLFNFIGDGFDDVKAFVSNLYWNLDDIEDNVFAIMRNSKTGQCASLHSTMTQWRHLFSFEVFMEKGYMVLNGLKTPSGTYGAEELVVAQNRSKAPAAEWNDEERMLFEADESWEKEMAIFCKAIQDPDFSHRSDSTAALEVMTLIDKIYETDTHRSDFLHRDLNASAPKA